MVRVSLVTADTAARMASRFWANGGAGGPSARMAGPLDLRGSRVPDIRA
jgi:hypothetical protein